MEVGVRVRVGVRGWSASWHVATVTCNSVAWTAGEGALETASSYLVSGGSGGGGGGGNRVRVRG